MLPFKRGMPLIKYLGLPLKFKDEEATQFVDEGRFLKCILLTIGEFLSQLYCAFLISINLWSRAGLHVWNDFYHGPIYTWC